MLYDYKKIPHAGIRSLSPYIPGKSAESLAQEQGLSNIIKLASNENPLGCSDAVKEALAELTSHQIATYTVSTQHPLRKKLSNQLNIDTEMVLLSNGSDNIFNLALICFALHTGKHMLTHQAAFIQYEIQAKTLGIPTYHVPLKSNFEVDIDGLIAACTEETAMIFLANPNNPTGLWIQKQDIQRLLDNVPRSTVVVLDEAYHEYLPADKQSEPHQLLSAYPNIVITRTFSKVYGLAALRLGYAIANPVLIELLYRVQLPFIVNQAAMYAASAALDDHDFIQRTLKVNHDGMVQMKAALDELNIIQLPSACNFITIDSGYDALIVDKHLQHQGVIVRPLHPYGLTRHLRITIGTESQNTRCLTALNHCLEELTDEQGTI
jgi:histidinol-phosphate aminotransferase